jgi:hypothetical protein
MNANVFHLVHLSIVDQMAVEDNVFVLVELHVKMDYVLRVNLIVHLDIAAQMAAEDNVQLVHRDKLV